MRDIKFRAWDLLLTTMINNIQNQYCTDKKVLYHSFKEILESGNPIMQYTGLKDKNGKEIYEGDIVNKQYHNLSVSDGVGRVHMGEGSDSDGWAHGIWLGWKAGGSSLLDVHNECEVIGSIYENKELLEGGVSNGTTN